MADSSNTSVWSHSFCLICRCYGRKLMPCPAKNPKCSNGCCRSCLISAIDNDQREPMRCQACHMKTTIEGYSMAIGFKNYTLAKIKLPIDQPAITALVPFNDDVDMEQARSGDQEMANRSMNEVGPRRELCPGLACQPDRHISLDYLVKCRDTCLAVYHAYCLLRVSNNKGDFLCGSCGWRKTHEEWFEYATNGNNFYRRHSDDLR